MVNLTSNDGLSNSSVNVIRQTTNGLMWFGTWDGLNMYNSKEFKTFKPELNNPLSISNNVIRDIVEENEDTYWISTDVGINRFNINTKKFERFFSDLQQQYVFNENSFFVSVNSNGKVFSAVSKRGLFFFDNEKNEFVPILQNRNILFRKIFFDAEDNLWYLTTDRKLYKIVLKKGTKDTPAIEKNIEFEHLKSVESAFYLQNDSILLQGFDRISYIFDIAAGVFSTLPISNHYSIGSIKTALHKDDFLLIGTDNGFYKYDYKSKLLSPILTNTSVLTLSEGTQGIIWVGTDMQGIWQLSPPKEKFNAYSFSNITGFGKSAVRTFCKDKENNLWVGTKGNGIYILNDNQESETMSIRRNLSLQDGLLSSSVYTIVCGFDNELWIGTDGKGLNYYDFGSHKLYTLNVPDSIRTKFNVSSVYTILPDENDVLWVGTSGYGVFQIKINKSTQPYSVQSFKQYTFNESKRTSLTNNIVYSILRDDEHHLWIATRGGGLNRFNTLTETFEVFKTEPENPATISSNDILTLYRDKSGYLWIGTSMGLNKLLKYEKGKPVFVRFTEKEGMPNNTIHGIREDGKGNIWVSTNEGLAKVVSEDEKYRIVSYNKKDGLQSNEFSDGASYADLSLSTLYFGGINGFNKFNPAEISQNDYMPPLWLDAFYVDNNEVNISDYIKKNKLILPYKNRTFSFRFIPLDYISGSKCEISYLLEGYQKDWIQLGTSNNIILSNLPSGNYALKVRSTNADKIRNEQYFSIPVVMSTPWWNSKFAHLIYAALIGLLILGIWRIVQNQIDAKNSIRLKELEKQKAEEIHQAKLRFFTNIAHEFSNSLTLIYGPCEQLLKQPAGQNTLKYVNTIRANSERMQGMIQQLIEFRKAETGHLKIEIEAVDITELIRYILDSFSEIMEQKKIECRLQSTPESIVWNTDRDSLEKVIFNLLSNAVKYTPDEELIDIQATVTNGKLQIEVKNTGVGIDPSFQKSIFDRFEVLNRFEKQISKGVETRNGIGLALCKSIVEVLNGTIDVKSDGASFTSFVVTLPEKEVVLNNNTISTPVAKDTPLSLNKESFLLSGSEESEDTVDIQSSKKDTVLVIDDEKDIRLFIRDTLQNKYRIIEAANGSEAINAMRQQLPSIVISDVIMPVMDGVEFVKMMKSQELTRYIPIILLSSRQTVESQISGLEVGADAYLGKPFHPRHMEVLVESLLKRNKSLRDYSDSPYAGMEKYEGKILHQEEKDLMVKITKIIHDNIQKEELSIHFIARETALSKIQLYRKIKENLEQTPTEYIRSIRLKQAEKLLKTTNKTVAEIMFECGFNNKAYFYREFSKKYAETPKEYRIRKSKQNPD